MVKYQYPRTSLRDLADGMISPDLYPERASTLCDALDQISLAATIVKVFWGEDAADDPLTVIETAKLITQLSEGTG